MGATQYLGYAKVLRLASPKSSSYEELITYCTTDIERIRDALILYVTVFGKYLINMMLVIVSRDLLLFDIEYIDIHSFFDCI